MEGCFDQGDEIELELMPKVELTENMESRGTIAIHLRRKSGT